MENRANKRYVLLPGYVRSANDKQQHFITARKLLELYKVDPALCVIYNWEQRYTDPSYERTNEWKLKLIHLDTRSKGDYVLPKAEPVPDAVPKSTWPFPIVHGTIPGTEK